MASLNGDADVVERVLEDTACFYAGASKHRTLRAFDRERGQFLLIDEGWDGYLHIHSVWAHVELRDGKFWIHEDGTEEGIANLLVTAGVPKDRIVLAFYAPSRRADSEFAAA